VFFRAPLQPKAKAILLWMKLRQQVNALTSLNVPAANYTKVTLVLE
jgi:hypothetical protein